MDMPNQKKIDDFFEVYPGYFDNTWNLSYHVDKNADTGYWVCFKKDPDYMRIQHLEKNWYPALPENLWYEIKKLEGTLLSGTEIDYSFANSSSWLYVFWTVLKATLRETITKSCSFNSVKRRDIHFQLASVVAEWYETKGDICSVNQKLNDVKHQVSAYLSECKKYAWESTLLWLFFCFVSLFVFFSSAVADFLALLELKMRTDYYIAVESACKGFLIFLSAYPYILNMSIYHSHFNDDDNYYDSPNRTLKKGRILFPYRIWSLLHIIIVLSIFEGVFGLEYPKLNIMFQMAYMILCYFSVEACGTYIYGGHGIPCNSILQRSLTPSSFDVAVHNCLITHNLDGLDVILQEFYLRRPFFFDFFVRDL